MSATSFSTRFEEASWRWVSTIALRPLLATLILGLICLASYLPGQTVLPALDRTEGMVALSSRHVLDTGDWFKPRWGPNIQRKRPVGTFWVQALSLRAHSDDTARNRISTYRLPSVVATTLGILALFWLARGLISPVPALLASAAMAVTPIITLHAQLAIAESLILPSIVVAQLALLATYREPTNARWWGWLGAFWLALGVSTWFNALAVPLLAFLTVAALCLLDRQWSLFKRLQPWFGFPLLAIFSLPWLASVWAIDGGTLYRGLGWRELLDALEGGQDMKFKTVYGVFVLTLILGFVPIAHMLGPVVARYWTRRHAPTIRFLLVWLIVPVIALELLSNKPPLYTVQAVMPAGALLAAMAVTRGSPYELDVRSMPGMFVGTVVLLLVIAPALFGGVLWATETQASAALILGFALFAGLFIYAAWLSAHGYGFGWLVAATVATFVFSAWFNGLLMAGLSNFWTAPQIVAASTKLNACQARPLAVSGFREPSLVLAHGPTVSPERAAEQFAQGQPVAIESRQLDRFKAAANAKAPVPQSSGCIRSLNLARGCSLVFEIYLPEKQVGTCQLDLPKDCSAGHQRLKNNLQIPHCR